MTDPTANPLFDGDTESMETQLVTLDRQLVDADLCYELAVEMAVAENDGLAGRLNIERTRLLESDTSPYFTRDFLTQLVLTGVVVRCCRQYMGETDRLWIYEQFGEAIARADVELDKSMMRGISLAGIESPSGDIDPLAAFRGEQVASFVGDTAEALRAVREQVATDGSGDDDEAEADDERPPEVDYSDYPVPKEAFEPQEMLVDEPAPLPQIDAQKGSMFRSQVVLGEERITGHRRPGVAIELHNHQTDDKQTFVYTPQQAARLIRTLLRVTRNSLGGDEDDHLRHRYDFLE